MQSCNLALTSTFVSIAHAMIRWDGQCWSIRDLGSRNGTYVNDAVVPHGETVALRRGARVAFGAPGELWELVDEGGPAPMVVPLDGGEPIALSQAINGLPDKEGPLATVYLDDGLWWLEHEDSRLSLQTGVEFSVAGRAYRFECPAGACATVATAEREWTLAATALIFDVSRDEEHVSLTIEDGDRTQDLGERAGFYLMLVLARERLRASGDAGMRGWLSIEALLRMVPDYTSGMHLNVEIFRLRRLLSGVGFKDAAGIIERRRGQIRLGSDQIQIRQVRLDTV